MPIEYLFKLINSTTKNIKKASLAQELINLYSNDLQKSAELALQNSSSDIILTKFKCYTITLLGKNSPINIMKAVIIIFKFE